MNIETLLIYTVKLTHKSHESGKTDIRHSFFPVAPISSVSEEIQRINNLILGKQCSHNTLVLKINRYLKGFKDWKDLLSELHLWLKTFTFPRKLSLSLLPPCAHFGELMLLTCVEAQKNLWNNETFICIERWSPIHHTLFACVNFPVHPLWFTHLTNPFPGNHRVTHRRSEALSQSSASLVNVYNDT